MRASEVSTTMAAPRRRFEEWPRSLDEEDEEEEEEEEEVPFPSPP